MRRKAFGVLLGALLMSLLALPTSAFASKNVKSTIDQRLLKEDIAMVWADEPAAPPQATQTTKHGGRVEQRQLWASDMLMGYMTGLT